MAGIGDRSWFSKRKERKEGYLGSCRWKVEVYLGASPSFFLFLLTSHVPSS